MALTETQYQRFQLEIEALGSRVQAIAGVMEQSPRWHHLPSQYSGTDLNGWELEWARHPALADADFALSDNLPGILNVRNNAVLFGSFLWSDVLDVHSPHSASCRTYVSRERDLLLRFRPFMLANADLATDGVRQRTKMVPLPWMISEKIQKVSSERPLVLVHGGGTRALRAEVEAITEALRQLGLEVVNDLIQDPNCFDYSESQWRRVGLVICRPGLGTVNECVRRQIPMLLMRDSLNSEAEYIRHRLLDLGMAQNYTPEMDAKEIERIRSSLNSKSVRAYIERPRGGVAKAVAWLVSHFGIRAS